MFRFSSFQIDELRNVAETILVSQKLDEQSWDDAWSGTLPAVPAGKEIEDLLNLLKNEVLRMLVHGVTDEDFSTTEKHIRMIYLESCKSINV